MERESLFIVKRVFLDNFQCILKRNLTIPQRSFKYCNMLYIPLTLIATMFFLSCGHQQQAKAKIFEKKELSKKHLMIKY